MNCHFVTWHAYIYAPGFLLGQCSIPLSFLHPTGVVLNSIYVQSQGRIIVDGVLVLILTCTPRFYDSTFGLLLLLMWTLLSRKLQNFNIIVMIIHCAGFVFQMQGQYAWACSPESCVGEPLSLGMRLMITLVQFTAWIRVAQLP